MSTTSQVFESKSIISLCLNSLQAYRKLGELLHDRTPLYISFSDESLSVELAYEMILAQLNSQENLPDIFVLDQCDNLLPELLKSLIPHLMQCHPNPIILLSRTIPDFIDDDDSDININQTLPNSDKVIHCASHQKPVLEVTGFGLGRVRSNGRPIDFSQHPMLHELFFYLLENPSGNRQQVLDQFWADKDGSISSFHVCRGNLNNLLGLKFSLAKDGYYEINPNITINYDVAQYRKLTKRAAYDVSAPTFDLYKSAYDLQHHDFLLNTHANWVQKARHKLRSQQSDLCFFLASISYDTSSALGLYSHAFRYNPYREDSIEAMMNIYLDEAMPCDAISIYHTLEANLQSAYSILPSMLIRDLMLEAKVHCNQ